MGAPEKAERVLSSPSLAFELRLLEMGKETGKKLDVSKLGQALELAKIILWPMVQGLDKEILPKPTGKTQERRGLLLFEDPVAYIWLLRSGKWLIWALEEGKLSKDGEREFKQCESHQLADFLIKNQKKLVKKNFKSGFSADILAELPFLKDIAVYSALFIPVFEQFFENASVILDERENRIKIMRERLALLQKFGKSFDLLASQGRKVILKEYSIWKESSHGSYNYASRYFSPEAVAPFWEHIKNSRSGDRFVANDSERGFGSLEEFLSEVDYVIGEIALAEQQKRRTAQEIFGFNSCRLPLIESEKEAIRKAAAAITGGENGVK